MRRAALLLCLLAAGPALAQRVLLIGCDGRTAIAEGSEGRWTIATPRLLPGLREAAGCRVSQVRVLAGGSALAALVGAPADETRPSTEPASTGIWSMPALAALRILPEPAAASGTALLANPASDLFYIAHLGRLDGYAIAGHSVQPRFSRRFPDDLVDGGDTLLDDGRIASELRTYTPSGRLTERLLVYDRLDADAVARLAPLQSRTAAGSPFLDIRLAQVTGRQVVYVVGSDAGGRTGRLGGVLVYDRLDRDIVVAAPIDERLTAGPMPGGGNVRSAPDGRSIVVAREFAPGGVAGSEAPARQLAIYRRVDRSLVLAGVVPLPAAKVFPIDVAQPTAMLFFVSEDGEFIAVDTRTLRVLRGALPENFRPVAAIAM